jgi:hypothetical protein
MSQETDVLLRTILYQVGMAESLEEARNAIKVMCTKDVIAAVEQQIIESKEIKKQIK